MTHVEEHELTQIDPAKRRLLALMGLAPLVSACSASDDTDALLKRKFHGIGGVVLWIHAVPSKRYVTVTDENGRVITAPSLMGSGGDNLSFVGPTLPIPKTIRVVWKEGAEVAWGKDGNIAWEGGTVAGDYTIPVAQRIPDELLNAARKNLAALRIKIRVTDHGVLLGWDLERSVPIQGVDYKHCKDPRDCVRALEWIMPGGDFKEARIYNGKAIEPGWYIGPDGRKIQTDY